ncbi:protein GID8 homolog [Zea mays]|uniref:LisH and RanBPM domains containing protein n=4 Tax=Zea mays TaxID=4577 RepID=A0A1D6JVD0_MAIZE|nr:protein GID8 homolog [Zea mays]ONL95759.1 LisH and RanBPM domains containing protein [Zea mays]|eukprot:XP_008653205.1 protein GID8 homolog [Zea mays]
MPSRPQSILGLSAVPFPRRNPSSSPRRRAVRCPSPRLRAPSLLPSHLMFFSRNAFRDLDPIDSPASMASSKKVATRDEWERKLRDVKIRKEDMNRLVMNFLVTEGFVDAADKFRIESGTQPEIDLAIIADRMEVKRAVQSGNVQEAIEKINDLNPTILDMNPQLYFHLQQQKLIELIREGKTNEALEFAQEELAPRGEENQTFLEEIEKTVALLIFKGVKNCPYRELLDVSQRLKTASEVNAAILASQSHGKDSKLPSLLKMLKWTQNHLDERAAYPAINDFTTAVVEDPSI